MTSYRIDTTGVEFDATYPVLLQGKMDQGEFQGIIDHVNSIYRPAAEKSRNMIIIMMLMTLCPICLVIGMGGLVAVGIGVTFTGASFAWMGLMAVPIVCFCLFSFIIVIMGIAPTIIQSRAMKDVESYLQEENQKLQPRGIQFLLKSERVFAGVNSHGHSRHRVVYYIELLINNNNNNNNNQNNNNFQPQFNNNPDFNNATYNNPGYNNNMGYNNAPAMQYQQNPDTMPQRPMW